MAIPAKCSVCGEIYPASSEHSCSLDDIMDRALRRSVVVVAAPAVSETSTYRYRDADKRREYMRDKMRERRAVGK